MKRIPLFRQALAALATCVLALVSAGAFAQATIQLTDPNCSDFSLGGSPGARTLTCVVSGPPVCTVNGPSAGSVGTAITLTASCSPAANAGGYVWTGDASCAASTSSTCQANLAVCASPPCNVNYTVTGTNGPGPGLGTGPTSPAHQVAWSTTPVAPSGCTISGAPAGNVPSGTAIALTINCTGGGQPTSWTWSGGAPCTGVVTQTCSGNITSTKTFTGTACSAPGVCSASTPGVTVTVGGGGGGGGGALDCSAQLAAAGAPGGTMTIDVAWPNDGSVHQYFTSTYGGYGGGAVVLRFTTSAATTANSKGSIIGVELGSSPATRHGALNTTPCDFNSGIPLFNCAGQTTAFNTTGPNVPLWQATGSNRSCAVTLQPSTTYYFNLYTVPGSTCIGQGSCDMLFNFQKPGGT